MGLSEAFMKGIGLPDARGHARKEGPVDTDQEVPMSTCT